MNEVILVRYGEIFLKGKNYSFFENTLFKNIRHRLEKIDLSLEKISGRFLISNFNAQDKNKIIDILKTVFGLVSISVAYEIDTSINNILDVCKTIKLKEKTFKVETKRADKTFEMKSFDYPYY